METFEIISAQKEQDGSIILVIANQETGEHELRRFADIRMGIHWPSSLSPACFVIVSQEYTGTPKYGDANPPVGSREIIAEYISETLGMNEFYRQIVVFVKKSLCRRLYAVLPEDPYQCGYFQDLQKYARNAECNIHINSVSEGDDFFLGISRIKDSTDSGWLSIPTASAVYDQLNSITREDLQDNPQERFYLIDALGHVLDGYYRCPPRNYPLITKRRPPPNWRYH